MQKLPAIPDKSKSVRLTSSGYKLTIVWRNVFIMLTLHLGAAYGLYLLFSGGAQWKTWWIAYVYSLLSAMSVTAGAHRLWAHKSYKAKLPLKILLVILNYTALQNSIYEWCRDHRAHHKFSETDGDPHNAKRGFFFAHVGWLLCKKHPDVRERGKTVDMSDLKSDPVVMWQHRHYLPFALLMCFIVPTVVPPLLWNETYWNAFFVAAILRYIYALNTTWLVNSVAHLWGPKPYNKNINPSENFFVILLTYGEGWHNYHHTFPWDYKTSEWGIYRYNMTTFFIDFFHWIGWAYDLRTASPDVIRQRVERCGDGSYDKFYASYSSEKQ